MIEGVEVKNLAVHADDRGRVMEIIRNDDPVFKGFGQAYMSTTLPDVVKGWHYHDHQWDHICCVFGMVKVALYDERNESSTKGEVNQFVSGMYAPKIIVVPPGVWHGWKCVGLEEAVVVNTVTKPYDPKNPDEHRLDPHENHIPFSWERKDG